MTATRAEAEFRAWVTIDLQALQNNLALARARRPEAGVVVIVKANAYGHGLVPVATALQSQLRPSDCFGVATLEEGLALRNAGLTDPVLLLEGVVTAAELQKAVDADLQLVLHSLYQLRQLQSLFDHSAPAQPLTLWLKVDTGMHRLGLSQSEFVETWSALQGHPCVRTQRVMTHFACADDPASAMTGQQLALLSEMLKAAGVREGQCDLSVAASAAILQWPNSHFQWLRPGIMLYGGSAILAENAVDRGLRPVMTLRSRIMAIKQVRAGETLGYGASYRCEEDMRIGIVSIGYGDGYPRHAPAGTPVLVMCRDNSRSVQLRAPICGRVSMDMLIVDLSACDKIAIGDEVILWGEGLPADDIARLSGTIAYELFCQVTPRVHYVYV